MDAWDGWETGRVILGLTAVWYVGIWVQLTLFHYAGAFKHKAMWGPVLVTPLFALAALLGMAVRDGVLGWIVLALLVVGLLEGLGGLYFHLKGMNYQIGGLRSLRNMLTGPPPVLPVAYALIGVVGIVGLTWNA